MQLFATMSIKGKQMGIIMLVTGLALTLACAAFGTYDVLTFRKTMARNLLNLGKIVGDNSAPAIDFDDPRSAADMLAQLGDDPHVTWARLYDETGKSFADYVRPNFPTNAASANLRPPGVYFENQRLEIYAPVDYRGDSIGTICIASDLDELNSRLQRYAAIAAGVFMISLLSAFLIAGRLQRLIFEPVLGLVRTARSVARDKNYSLRATRGSQDEIGVLIDGFNEMLSQIEARDASLQNAHNELEQRVAARTEELRWKSALLEAQLDSSSDGILVMSPSGDKIYQNGRVAELWNIPEEIVRDPNHERQIQFAAQATRDYEKSLAVIRDVHSRPDAKVRDELELKDGTVLDRNSYPIIGKDGVCYGRVWTFRDITDRKRAEEELRAKTALLEAQTNSSLDGILVVDNERRTLVMNERFARLHQLPPEIAATSDCRPLLEYTSRLAADPEDFRKRVEYLYAHPFEASQDEVHFTSGLVLDRFSGPVLGKDGVHYGRIWTFRDVTERKRMEKELERERDLLETLLTNSPDSIYFKDLDSRFLRVSRSLAQRVALDASAVIGKTDFDLFDREHAKPALEDEQRIMRTGEPIIGKVEKETSKQGKVAWALTSKMPLRAKDGTIIGTFGISKDITAIKTAEAELEQAHHQLLETSRLAGMAEVATSVLHNVGNVLNSVNVSCSVVCDRVRKSKSANLARAVALMKEHDQDLGHFLSEDPKGRQLPGYLGSLADHLGLEQKELLDELALLSSNVDHIKQIVAMQQSYSKVSGVRETLPPVELVEDALRMNGAALQRHRIKVIRDFGDTPPVEVERHKVLQILINLIRNAKYACDEGKRPDKEITLRVWKNGTDQIHIAVADNGIGIAPENLTRVFQHGFTTRKEGHGFGLHSAALAAKDLGGSIALVSEGIGHGATFTLSLPCVPRQK